MANPPRARLKPRGPPARLAASGGDPGTVLPRPGGEGGRRQAGREGAGSRLPVPLAPPPYMSSRRLSHRFVLPSSFSSGGGLPPIFLTQTCCRAAPGINAIASLPLPPTLPSPSSSQTYTGSALLTAMQVSYIANKPERRKSEAAGGVGGGGGGGLLSVIYQRPDLAAANNS